MRSSIPGASRALAAILPGALVAVVEAVEALAAAGRPAWVVGGVVRDLYLGRPSEDLDLMVEPWGGPGADPFILALAEATGAELHDHPRFLTTVLALPTGERVDVAHCRTETYAAPAALPEVSPGSFEDDLRRRDFTLNAMALRIEGPGGARLEDPHGGLADLEAGRLRILHDRSFEDDPTRLYRGIRFWARLSFPFEPRTRALAEAAFASGGPDRLSAERLSAELRGLAVEPHFPEAARLLGALGGWGSLGLPPPPGWVMQALRRIVGMGAAEPWGGGEVDVAEAQLMTLALGSPPEAREEALCRWCVRGARLRRAREGLQAADGALRLAEGPRPSPAALTPLLERMGAEIRAALWARVEGEPAAQALGDAATRLGAHPPLTGADVLRLGAPRGPAVGEILAALRGAWLGGEISDGPEAEALARRLIEERLT